MVISFQGVGSVSGAPRLGVDKRCSLACLPLRYGTRLFIDSRACEGVGSLVCGIA